MHRCLSHAVHQQVLAEFHRIVHVACECAIHAIGRWFNLIKTVKDYNTNDPFIFEFYFNIFSFSFRGSRAILSGPAGGVVGK